MKAFLAVCFMLFVLQARCDDAKDSAAAEDSIKVYKRLIPADVLRGKVFSSVLAFVSPPFSLERFSFSKSVFALCACVFL